MAEDLVLEVLELFGSEPGGTVGGAIEGGDRQVKNFGQQPLAKVQPQAEGGVLGNALSSVDDLPAESLELLQKWLFDFGVFAHGCLKSFKMGIG